VQQHHCDQNDAGEVQGVLEHGNAFIKVEKEWKMRVLER